MVARRAFALSLLDKYAGLLINIGSSMLLARLLSPAEIGVFSVTMVFVGILTGLRDLGASSYLIQEKDLTDDRIRAAWTIQLFMGFGLALLLALIARPLAAYYQKPELIQIFAILTLNFVINPFGSIAIAWWAREMQYQWIALSRFAGAITGAGVSIGLAWRGFGAESLAWSSLATTMAGVLVTLALRPKHLPVLPGLREIRRVFSFGGRMAGISILWTLTGGAPEAFLGRFQDMTQTGFYSRANGLVSMFDRLVMDAVNSVTLPLFSRMKRGGEPIGSLYIRAISLVTGLGWTFQLCLAVAAFPVMEILYGHQWTGAVTVCQILCVNMSVALPISLSNSLIIAHGMAGRALSIIMAIAIFKVPLSLIGAMYGLHTLAWILVMVHLGASVAFIYQAKMIVQFSWRELLRALCGSCMLAFVSATPFLTIALCSGFERGAEAWIELVMAGGASIVLLIFFSKHLGHPLFEEISGLYVKYGRRYS